MITWALECARHYLEEAWYALKERFLRGDVRRNLHSFPHSYVYSYVRDALKETRHKRFLAICASELSHLTERSQIALICAVCDWEASCDPPVRSKHFRKEVMHLLRSASSEEVLMHCLLYFHGNASRIIQELQGERRDYISSLQDRAYATTALFETQRVLRDSYELLP